MITSFTILQIDDCKLTIYIYVIDEIATPLPFFNFYLLLPSTEGGRSEHEGMKVSHDG